MMIIIMMLEDTIMILGHQCASCFLRAGYEEDSLDDNSFVSQSRFDDYATRATLSTFSKEISSNVFDVMNITKQLRHCMARIDFSCYIRCIFRIVKTIRAGFRIIVSNLQGVSSCLKQS